MFDHSFVSRKDKGTLAAIMKSRWNLIKGQSFMEFNSTLNRVHFQRERWNRKATNQPNKYATSMYIVGCSGKVRKGIMSRICCVHLLIQLRKRPFVKWKAVRVHYSSRHVFTSLALYHCVTVMVVIARCSVDHLENAGVWIDMAMSCQWQRPKECLTVV